MLARDITYSWADTVGPWRQRTQHDSREMRSSRAQAKNPMECRGENTIKVVKKVVLIRLRPCRYID